MFVVHLVLVVAVGIALALGVPEPGTVGPLRIRPRGLEVTLEVRPAFVRAQVMPCMRQGRTGWRRVKGRV